MNKVIVIGTSDYQWLMLPFAALLKKYAPEITAEYFCDQQAIDLPPNVNFRRVPGIPTDRWDWYSHDFSVGLKNILIGLRDPYPLICLPDMWLSAKPDLEGIKHIENYLFENRNVLSLFVGTKPNLTSYLNNRVSQRCHNSDIFLISPNDEVLGAFGSLFLNPCLWKKGRAAELIEGTTIWDFEIWHKQKIKRANLLCGFVLPALWPYGHALGRDNPKRLVLGDQFAIEDVGLIKSLVPKDVEIFI